MANIIDVYLQDAHFNSICNANIPGAWVVVVENNLGVITQPFAIPSEYSNTDDARIAAHDLFD